MSAPRAQAPALSAEALVFGFVAAFGALAVAVWWGAQLASLLFGAHRWLPVGPRDAFLAVPQLAAHPARPADAWPAVAAHLPGAAGYWAASVVPIAVAVFAVAVLLALTSRRVGVERRRRMGLDPEARFAGLADLAPLLVTGPTPGRLLLGTVRTAGRVRLVATEDAAKPLDAAVPRRLHRAAARRRSDRGAVLALGPTRCGKTAALAVPAILEWDGPLIAVSVKTDLLGATEARRRALGEVRVFDPAGATGQPSAGWSPLTTSQSLAGARRAARSVAASTEWNSGGSGDMSFWTSAGEDLVGLLFWLAAQTGLGMDSVMGWITTQDKDTVLSLSSAFADHLDPTVAVEGRQVDQALQAVWRSDARQLSSVYLVARQMIRPWQEPTVQDSAIPTPGAPIDLDWLLGTSTPTSETSGPHTSDRMLPPATWPTVDDDSWAGGFPGQIAAFRAAAGGWTLPPTSASPVPAGADSNGANGAETDAPGAGPTNGAPGDGANGAWAPTGAANDGAFNAWLSGGANGANVNGAGGTRRSVQDSGTPARPRRERREEQRAEQPPARPWRRAWLSASWPRRDAKGAELPAPTPARRPVNSLYVCADLDDAERLAPVLGGLVDELLRDVYQHVGRTGKPLDPPLLLVIDEAGNWPMRSLPSRISTCAGMGVVLLLLYQSKAQIDAAYGPKADIVVSNATTKVFFSGLSDRSSLDYAASLLGQEHIAARSVSSDSSPGGGRTGLSEAPTRLELLPAALLRQVAPGEALLIHRTLPPIHLRGRYWFRDPHLRRLATGGEPAGPAGAGRATGRPRRAGRPHGRRRERRAVTYGATRRGAVTRRAAARTPPGRAPRAHPAPPPPP
ncbi:type IV secretory system conjugative DNA transfer family protein, partial [Frankia nepalensis]|uniref:type IV secretory system conjugative DNA transfer family protein n=1 Tax=Frankia nepalensis TaxID=1836974 RepID=UPI00288A7737